MNTLDDIARQFQYSDSELVDVYKSFLDEMESGLYGKSTLKMLSSHVHNLPTGNEQGIFYAVDLGGSNLRILRVSLNGIHSKVVENRSVIPLELLSASSTCNDLFDYIAIFCKKSVSTNGDYSDSSCFPVGFTFSFPCEQTSIDRGRLIEWTKGFQTSGCVNEDPVRLLNESFARNSVNLRVVALCNDTVGTLVTNAYSYISNNSPNRDEHDDRDVGYLGVILGTGTNAAYVEKASLVINTEWGGFNSSALKLTRFDAMVDEASPNPGKQIMEKMMSGMYLGELTRLASMACCSELDAIPRNNLETSHVSDIMQRSDSNEIIRDIGNAVFKRSAGLCAAALCAVMNRCEKKHVVIGMDGSLFNKGYMYKEHLQTCLERLMKLIHTMDRQQQQRDGRRLLTAETFEIVHSTDGSGFGAALIAASRE